MLKKILLGVFALGFLGAGTAIANPAQQVKISGFTYAGTGCPSGSVGSLISSDNQTLELLFDKFQANLAPANQQVPFAQQNNCSVSVKLKLPRGFSASFYKVEHRGYADTRGGANGQFRARYYIPGAGGFDVNRNYNFQRNLERDYTIVHDNIATAYTQCGAEVPMTVSTRIGLSGRPTGYNALTVDSQSNKVTTRVHYQLRRCK
ncbi:MAG: DUF4360 domain-containing protein [Scytonematopsis contorta HA4267-MV1]|jgi:hypothetical protein|nr:DUF4360 domain-containing protein [Scytonematopsis contorta HA4267-MV1]